MAELHYHCGRCRRPVKIRKGGGWIHANGNPGHEAEPVEGRAPAEPAPPPRPATAAKVYRPWTGEEDDEIRSAYAQGRPAGWAHKLAERFGRTPAAVYTRAAKIGATQREPAEPTQAPPPTGLAVEVSPAVYRYLALLAEVGVHGTSVSSVAARLMAQRVEHLIIDGFLAKAEAVRRFAEEES